MNPLPFLISEPWTIDRLTVSKEGASVRVDMDGWAFPDPELGPAAKGDFLLNGRPFDEIHYPVDREHVGKVFWQRKNARFSGFRCVVERAYEDVYPDGVMELTYVNPGPPRKVAAQQSWYLSDLERGREFPDEERRYRVIGNRGLQGFALTGLTDFKRLCAAVYAMTGKEFADYASVLDWGCGCGRLARYTSDLPRIRFTGCDIDADNLKWCATHLAGAFVPTQLAPPLPFGDGSFDLVYGVSVFTHLRRHLQDTWLTELYRITSRGAVLMMTVHGTTALDYAGVSQGDHAILTERIRREGLYVSSSNSQLDGHADHGGEYVNVFHDMDYLLKHWGGYFEIVGVLPGYIYTHDLVVMRKR